MYLFEGSTFVPLSYDICVVYTWRHLHLAIGIFPECNSFTLKNWFRYQSANFGISRFSPSRQVIQTKFVQLFFCTINLQKAEEFQRYRSRRSDIKFRAKLRQNRSGWQLCVTFDNTVGIATPYHIYVKWDYLLILICVHIILKTTRKLLFWNWMNHFQNI